MSALKGFALVPAAGSMRPDQRGAAEAWERLALAAKTLRGIQMVAYGAAVQPAGPGRDVTELVLNRVLTYVTEDATVSGRYEAQMAAVAPAPEIPPDAAGVLVNFLSEYTGRPIPQGNAELFEAAFEAVTTNDLFDDGLETQARRGHVLGIICEYATVAMTGFREQAAPAHRKGEAGAN